MSLYTAAKLTWTDRGSLYDLEKQRLVQEPIDPSRGSWVLPFFYPPFFAAVLVPLAWLPFSAAFVMMSVVNLVLLFAAIKILIQHLELNRHQVNWLILATFCNYGVHYALLEAQTSFIALLLLVLFVRALRGSTRRECGIWSGLLFFKPQLAAAPLLILLVRKRWRQVSLALIVMASLGLVSLLVVGLDGMQAYWELSRRAASGEDTLHIQPEGMQNLRALADYFLGAPWRDYVWWLGTLAVMAVIVIHSWPRHGSGGMTLYDWAVILIGLILVAPHLHSHDLVLLIVPAAFLVKSAGEPVPPVISLALVLVGIFPLVNTVAFPHLPPLVPLASLVFLATDLRRGTKLSMTAG